jgi:hypothetical protein
MAEEVTKSATVSHNRAVTLTAAITPTAVAITPIAAAPTATQASAKS